MEKHELECDYQLQQCPGCRLQILTKDFLDHINACLSIELTCDDCKIVYRRGESMIKHTEMKCLKEQLRQMRDECREMRLVLSESIDMQFLLLISDDFRLSDHDKHV